jgi:hypothetical protein
MVQWAVVTIDSTEAGATPEAVFAFEARHGASADQPGTVIASGSTDDDGRVSLQCTAESGPKDCFDAAGTAPVQFPPGVYQVCETGLLPGWDNDLDGFEPGADDGSTECVDLELTPGAGVAVQVDNKPPPGGIAHRPAFWMNWTSCVIDGTLTPVLDDTLATYPDGETSIGIIFIGTCEAAVPILNEATLDGIPQPDDPAYLLAAESLAAELNFQAAALTCLEAETALSEAQAQLEALGFDGLSSHVEAFDDPTTGPGLRASVGSLTDALRGYNTNSLCERDTEGSDLGVLVPILVWPAFVVAGRAVRRRRKFSRPRELEGTVIAND